ncbi:MAG: RNA polymerase sigma factor [Rudaea sp.]
MSPPAPDEATLPPTELQNAIPRLRRYARVLAGNFAAADDLVQDTLIRAWDKRRLWQAGSDLRAWLFTIMHNVFMNQRVAARREAANVSLDAEAGSRPAAEVATFGNALERIELREALRYVDRLPPEQREVLLLAVVEELRYEEVAAMLGIPVGTVMSRLSRARARLRRMTGYDGAGVPTMPRRRNSSMIRSAAVAGSAPAPSMAMSGFSGRS